jgi:hypothetical protein
MKSVVDLVSDNWRWSVDRDVLEKYKWLQRYHPAEQSITTTAIIIVLAPLTNTAEAHAVFPANFVSDRGNYATARN